MGSSSIQDAEGSEIPLGSFAVLTAAFAVAATATAVLLGRSRQRLPDGIPAKDVMLLGVATHKLSRWITRDRITRPLRAPFTQTVGEDGLGEAVEKPRGSGLQQAIGWLVSCQWCLAPWIALPMAVGLVRAPRATRFGAGVLATLAVSDALQLAFEAEKAVTKRISDPRHWNGHAKVEHEEGSEIDAAGGAGSEG